MAIGIIDALEELLVFQERKGQKDRACCKDTEGDEDRGRNRGRVGIIGRQGGSERGYREHGIAISDHARLDLRSRKVILQKSTGGVLPCLSRRQRDRLRRFGWEVSKAYGTNGQAGGR